MPISSDQEFLAVQEDVRAIAHALLDARTAHAAALALRGHTCDAAVLGLVELIHESPSADAAVAAISALERCTHALVNDALQQALESVHVTVRLAALSALGARGAASAVTRVLKRDPSWMVRRAAVTILAGLSDPDRWLIFTAADDPHWRVRHALIQALVDCAPSERAQIDERLARAGTDIRARGLREYVRFRWNNDPPAPCCTAIKPEQNCAFWDWDGAVLARDLRRLGDDGRKQAIGSMSFLLGHADSRVTKLAAESLRRWGRPEHLVEVVNLLDDYRSGKADAGQQLLATLDLDRIEAAARLILNASAASTVQLAWAIAAAESVFPAAAEEPRLLELLRRLPEHPAAVRAALAGLGARWHHPQARGCLRGLLDDEDGDVRGAACLGLLQTDPGLVDETVIRRLLADDHAPTRLTALKIALAQQRCELATLAADDRDARVRSCLAEALAKKTIIDPAVFGLLQSDPHPHVRAAALNESRAAELIAKPEQEHSWHVLARAARICKVPFWKLAPAESWQPAQTESVEPTPLLVTPRHAVTTRPLGKNQLRVAPLAISGHYGLPVEGYAMAVQAGVNLFFWEPSYHALSEFVRRLSGADRRGLHFLSGSFEAEGKLVRRDAERALRLLGLERLDVFLLFWVQNWRRVTPDVQETLAALQQEGKIGTFGLSTHSRSLAVEAMETGWDPVMVRHNAAHRGAEEQVLPRAAALGASILTFNATCYGRLLRHAPISAADCYRYSLGQPGVKACFSAPATMDQLKDNLSVLHEMELPSDRRELLRGHGDHVYREDTAFRICVKSL